MGPSITRLCFIDFLIPKSPLDLASVWYDFKTGKWFYKQ